MFKAFKAWRELLKMLQWHPSVWVCQNGRLVQRLHGHDVEVWTEDVGIFFARHAAHVSVDACEVPLGPWRRWRLKNHITRVLLRKAGTAL